MSRVIAKYTKDTNARLDYSIDWSEWLSTGETISSAAWSVSGDDSALVVGTSTYAPSVSGGVATSWWTAGTEGVAYRVTCQVTTSAGRIDERSVTITVADR